MDWLWHHNDLLNVEPDFIQDMKAVVVKAITLAEQDGLSPHSKWEFVETIARECSRSYAIARMKKERSEKASLQKYLAAADDANDTGTVVMLE